jgi:hypothetical protein
VADSDDLAISRRLLFSYWVHPMSPDDEFILFNFIPLSFSIENVAHGVQIVVVMRGAEVRRLR